MKTSIGRDPPGIFPFGSVKMRETQIKNSVYFELMKIYCKTKIKNL